MDVAKGQVTPPIRKHSSNGRIKDGNTRMERQALTGPGSLRTHEACFARRSCLFFFKKVIVE